MEGKWNHVRYAQSLAEVYQHASEISEELRKKKEKETPILWFRGHAKSSYHLEPCLFRGATYQYNREQTYGGNHLREEYRFQSFMSKNYDNLDYRMPQTVIEWQEVMQHFFTKTRLMDWSESLVTSLGFALESFITPVKDLESRERCRTADPMVWILHPQQLNQAVYQSFVGLEGQEDGKELIRSALVLEKAEDLTEKIWEELKEAGAEKLYCDIADQHDQNMSAFVGLSALEMIRAAYKGKEAEALRRFEMNPFFYLLLRYYADGVPVEMGRLVPLAIIHPYHSQRIRQQKGVFTIYPHYIPGESMERVKRETGTYLSFGMEYMEKCIPCLYGIRLLDPEKIARELMLTGAKRSDLYPEMETVSRELENVAR